MKKLSFCALLFLFTTTATFAQQSNAFLNRDYWKTNPTISDIDAKIKAGNDISELNGSAFDAVCYALMEKVDNETVKYLLSKEGNGVNKKTHDGRTYIFWAAYRGNLEMMKYLVDNGAKTDVVDSDGYSVMNFAARSNQTDTKLYDFLFKHGADVTTEKTKSGANALLLLAPYMEDTKLIDYFVSKGADINVTDNAGDGLFNYAAKGGNLNMLKTLITKGLTYKALNKTGGNAILTASQGIRGKQNTLEFYNFLEDLGIAVNVVGDRGRNPLHAIAYNSEDLDIFKYFISKGVDAALQDNGGDSPFMNAANSNTIAVVKYLSAYIKDINVKDENGRSALAMAINRNNAEVAKFLIEKGADISTVDTDGNTLAYYLLNTFRTNAPEAFNDKFNLLTKAGLDMTATQGEGKTLYHLAVEKNNLELLKRLKSLAIDINAKNNDGLTPLHLAAMKAKDANILKYLVTIGADKTVKTDFEESVYDLAQENELLKKENSDITFLK